MDWQVVILTLGASLITGIITIIGNIIVSRASLKKTIVDNQHSDKKEFIDKRFKAYDKILTTITSQLETKIIKDDIFDEQKAKIEKVWRENYHYCSKQINRDIQLLIRFFDYSFSTKQRIKNLSDLMKKDIDSFYGIKDKLKK